MKRLHKPIFLFLAMLAVLLIDAIPQTNAQQYLISPTPTYDPLEEPLLPPNPTEFELGRNLYWHWCMTCHGDQGQGLIDEFRAIWEPEHQNCWGRGCHAGRIGDEGFPIPTVVPALVNEAHLAQFESVQELSDFLKATHPPQSPGVLKDDEYHVIALFVFTMNGRLLSEVSSTSTPALIPTGTSNSARRPEQPEEVVVVSSLVLFGALIALLLFFIVSRGRVREKDKLG